PLDRGELTTAAAQGIPNAVGWAEYRYIGLAVKIVIGRNGDIAILSEGHKNRIHAVEDVPGAVRRAEYGDVGSGPGAFEVAADRYVVAESELFDDVLIVGAFPDVPSAGARPVNGDVHAAVGIVVARNGLVLRQAELHDLV